MRSPVKDYGFAESLVSIFFSISKTMVFNAGLSRIGPELFQPFSRASFRFSLNCSRLTARSCQAKSFCSMCRSGGVKSLSVSKDRPVLVLITNLRSSLSMHPQVDVENCGFPIRKERFFTISRRSGHAARQCSLSPWSGAKRSTDGSGHTGNASQVLPQIDIEIVKSGDPCTEMDRRSAEQDHSSWSKTGQKISKGPRRDNDSSHVDRSSWSSPLLRNLIPGAWAILLPAQQFRARGSPIQSP